MINTYEAYLKHEAGDILTIEDALKIYSALAKSIEQCQADYKMECWDDVLKNACDYTKIRNDWEHMSNEQKMEADPGRTRIHDGFIAAINVLSRVAEKEGVDNSWREELGESRKRIGDFACFITYMTGISNR